MVGNILEMSFLIFKKAQLEAEGHTAVQPSQFFLTEESSSSLLIILRNEDIAEHICEVMDQLVKKIMTEATICLLCLLLVLRMAIGRFLRTRRKTTNRSRGVSDAVVMAVSNYEFQFNC